MQSSFPDSLTRFVVDEHRVLELAQMPWILDRIQQALPQAVPVAQRELMGVALLNLAIQLLYRES